MIAPIDLERFRLVLGGLVEAAVAPDVAVRWGTPYPRPAFPYVALNIMAPATGLHLPRNEFARLPTRVLVAFSGATAGSERVLLVNTMRHATVADTDLAHRDLMVAAIAGSLERVTALDVDETTLEVVPAQAGALEGVRAGSPGMEVTVLEEADYLVKVTACRLTVAIEAFGKAGRKPEPDEVIEAVMVALDEPEARQTMAEHRIGFSAIASSGARNLSSIEGVDTESRVQRDLEFSIESRRVRPADTAIEGVEIQRGVG